MTRARRPARYAVNRALNTGYCAHGVRLGSRYCGDCELARRPAPQWVGIVADGQIIWTDSDGASAWAPAEANSLAEALESMGYATSLFESWSGAAAPHAIG